ncbi:MEDS domain-containing protein [Planococcus dechangensis]|uniref:MEDS domain-containing protein n=1 Tax=Planococcus dechangensis TaxID=1176255 RepID=A0ABV9MEQ9_9BACL
MNQETIDFTETLCQMEGAHIFYLTEKTELYISNAVSYIIDGVQKGERVLFVENSRLYPKIEKKLKQLLTAEEMEFLLYINNFDFYWRKGNFHPEAILDYFEKVVGSFTADGRQCRTWGHIEWGSQEDIEEKILTYEKEIDLRVPHKQVISVCAYDALRVSDQLSERLMHCHGYFMKDNSIAALTFSKDSVARK